MIRWFLSLFGFKSGQKTPLPKPNSPTRKPPPAAAPQARETGPADELPTASKDFLSELVADAEPLDLQTLPPDDRVFLSGILKRIRENQLVIPLLPQAALELSRLLGNPNSHLDDFVRVLEGDPALSVDVLRVANSAFYGFSGSTQSVHQAVVRVGVNQIRGLVIVAHLQGRVLQTGAFHAEAGLLTSLSMAVAQTSQDLASTVGLDRDAVFTRGILSHVEHFIIMGTAADVSREHQRKINPSSKALGEAFRRFGPRVRELAARTWGLEELMLGVDGEDPAATLHAQLARALIARWSGQQGAAGVDGISPERWEASLGRYGKPDATRGTSS